MSSVCLNLQPAGMNGNCLKFPAPVSNIVIADGSQSFSDMIDFVTYNTWRTAIQESLTLYTPASVESYEVTTPDPTINTTAKNSQIFVRKGVPAMVAYMTSNNCDFNEMQATLKGGTYGVYFILTDGSVMGMLSTLGTIRGFKARITASTMGVPAPDTIENAFPLYINFTNAKEFEKTFIQIPAWSPEPDLTDIMPLGMTMIQSSAYATGDAQVYLEERCGDPALTRVVGDFIIVDSSNLDTPAITALAEDGNGYYTLTIQKESTPTNLVAGDWVIIQEKSVTGSVVDEISGRLLIQA